MMQVSRKDVVTICEAIGFTTAIGWNRTRMEKKLVNVATDKDLDPSEDLDDRLRKVWKGIVEAGGVVTIVEGEVEEEPAEDEPLEDCVVEVTEKVDEELEDDDEESEDDELEDEEEGSEEEDGEEDEEGVVDDDDWVEEEEIDDDEPEESPSVEDDEDGLKEAADEEDEELEHGTVVQKKKKKGKKGKGKKGKKKTEAPKPAVSVKKPTRGFFAGQVIGELEEDLDEVIITDRLIQMVNKRFGKDNETETRYQLRVALDVLQGFRSVE